MKNKKEIAILLPNKEDYSLNNAAAASIWVNDFNKKNLIWLTISYFTDGKFGAMMQVHIENDGPVTITIESPQKKTSETKDEWCNSKGVSA